MYNFRLGYILDYLGTFYIYTKHYPEKNKSDIAILSIEHKSVHTSVSSSDGSSVSPTTSVSRTITL